MQKRKEDRVFKHYFIMYFFVLLIPMIICCTYYSYMFFVINEDDISSHKNDLVPVSYTHLTLPTSQQV